MNFKLIASLAFLNCVSSYAGTSADAPNLPLKPSVVDPRIYVLDCGTLVYNNPEKYNLTRDEVKHTNMAVTCYLIVHPKGTLLYDTGLNDNLVGRPLYENIKNSYAQIVQNTLSGQLAEIGYTPDKIDYLMLSHRHFDHVGNANIFNKSTWLVSEKERDLMFTQEAKKEYAYKNYKDLEGSKFKQISEAYDVFGDGSVVTIPTPGHTHGHTSLKIELKNAGAKILTGDLYHYDEERTLGRMPEQEKSTETPQSRQTVENMLKKHNAELWIGHSLEHARNVRKSPAWYD